MSTEMAKVHQSAVIDGVIVVEPTVFADDRGLFVETWRDEWIPSRPMMVQGNRADRSAGTLVGLHYHLYQADYWYVPAGRAFVALADLRPTSPTKGAVLTDELGGDTHRALYIPPGVAHGFFAITDVTITYMVDAYYDPADELGVAWNDPQLAVPWPAMGAGLPVLSGRDQALLKWGDVDPALLPT